MQSCFGAEPPGRGHQTHRAWGLKHLRSDGQYAIDRQEWS